MRLSARGLARAHGPPRRRRSGDPEGPVALGQRDDDDVTRRELPPPALLDLAADGDLALGEQLPGVGAGLGDAGELEELAEADAVLVDRDVLGVGVLHGHESASPRARPGAGRPPRRPSAPT